SSVSLQQYFPNDVGLCYCKRNRGLTASPPTARTSSSAISLRYRCNELAAGAPTARLTGPEEPEDAMGDERYYPTDGTYLPFPGIFATWLGAHGDAPNPCRKYHVSTDLTCAGRLAAVALPILQDLKLSHKIVQSHSKLVRM